MKKRPIKIGCGGAIVLSILILAIIGIVTGGRDKTSKTGYAEKDESYSTTELTTSETATEEDKDESTAVERTGISEDFKKFWDSYEAFIDTYIYAMNHMDSMDTTEYMQIMEKYSQFLTEIDNYNEDNLTPEEYAYMMAVLARVNVKLYGAI